MLRSQERFAKEFPQKAHRSPRDLLWWSRNVQGTFTVEFIKYIARSAFHRTPSGPEICGELVGFSLKS